MHAHHSLIVYSLSGFFLLGLFGSLHCLGMCAPLSMLFLSPPSSRRHTLIAIAAYHLGRLLSYALLGAMIAALGERITHALPFQTHPLIAITLLSLPLLAYALGVELPQNRTLQGLANHAFTFMRRRHPLARALSIGLITPILPCGLLYGVLAMALAAPSPGSGAAWLAAFSLGTVPLLTCGQLGIDTWSRRLSPPHRRRLLRALAALAALALIAFSLLHSVHAT